jgi:hypothetical protein
VGLRNLSIAPAFDLVFSRIVPSSTAAAELYENFSKILCRILLPADETSLRSLKFSTIVLGGTAALHAYRPWGAVIFWRRKFTAFFLLVILLLLDCL